MTKLSTLILAIIGMVSMSFTNPVETEIVTYTVDTQNSQVIWKGYKVTGSHEGTIQLNSGSFEFDKGQLTGGSFVIDMGSINCTDLDGKMKGKLEGHLKSGDFFGVENHPTAKLVITKVAPQGKPGEFKVTGDLTIKDITKPVKFFTKVTEEMGKTVATSDIKIDRSEYNVKYGSGSFFDNLGDKTIYDEFDLQVKLVASK